MAHTETSIVPRMNEEFDVGEAGRKEKKDFSVVMDFFLVLLWVCLFWGCFWFCSLAYFILFLYVGGVAGMRGEQRGLSHEQNWGA